MKVKLLCLILLCAMLVTGIPVAATAAETVESTEEVRSEYYDLYVKEGLVGLFTAFDPADTTVSLAGGKGTWQNRVTGGAAATFGGTTGWTQGQTGGVGYTLVYGEMDTVAGSYSASSTHTTLDRDNRLIFDLGLLPTEDFTVEYLACYTPVYAYDTATGTLVDAFAQNISGYDTPLSGIYTPVDAVGFLCSYTTHRGGYFNSAGIAATLGLVRWRSVDKAGYKTWEANGYGWGDSLVTANRTTRKVESYAITRDETTVTADDATTVTATYTHFFNAAKVCATTYSSANTTGDYRYYTVEDNTEFYLSRMLGTDFYAVRVYSQILTSDEMKQNRAVDVLNYYAPVMDEALISDSAYLARVYDALSEVAIETDATLYAAKRAEVQSIVDGCFPEFADAHDLYVKDELSLLFTTFGTYADTANLTAGTWTDIVSGKVATFKYSGTNTWVRNANGSVGFTVFRGAEVDGAVTADSAATDTYQNTNNRLQFGIALLPESDFTVEYLAMYKPLYVYDANESDRIARDENGGKRETFLEGVSVGLHVEREIDELGWFSSRASLLDTTKHYWQGEGVLGRGSVHWFYNCHYWSYNPVAGGAYNNQYYLGANGAHAPASGLNITTDPFQTNGVIRTYGISLDETLTVASDGTRTTEALFTLYRNATLYNSNASHINTTARGEDARGGYIDIDTPYITATSSTCSRTHDFWLSSTRATDFFGVRVYAKALSDAEKLQNHAVDVLLYYGISVPVALVSDASAMSRIYTLLGDEELVEDATQMAATRIRLQAVVNAETSRADLLDRYAAREHLTALFTTFYPDTVDLTAGTWTDLVSGKKATLSHGSTTAWTQNENGAIGYNTFYGAYDDSDADGVKEITASATSDTHRVAANRLELGISMLPASDFSVEYMAMYKPVYVYDATEEDLIARDADGSKRESALEGLVTPLHVEYPIDQLGWFTSMASRLDSTSHYWSGANTVGRGTVQWQFDNPRWYYGHNTWYVGGGGHAAGSGLNITTDAYQTNDRVRVYGIYLDETLTVTTAEDGTETRKTTALFSTYRDGVLYNSNASALNTTDVTSGGKTYYDIDTPFVSGEHKFWLSSTRATDFFTVRVYDIALTDAQKQQNYAIDMMLYYGVAVPDALFENAATREALYTLFAAKTAQTDVTLRTATHTALSAKVDALAEMLDADTGLSALYARPDALTALYSVYTASVHTDMGVWFDLVGGNAATLGNAQMWQVRESGAVGYDLFYGMMGTDGAYTASSAYNTYATNGTRLEFGIDALPSGDFTVEYVAEYRPVYVADTQGGIAKDESGNPVETVAVNPVGTAADGSTIYNTPGSQQYGGNATAPIDQLGFFHSWTTNRDGKFSNSGVRGGLYWCFGDLLRSDATDGWSAYYWSQSLYKTSDSFYHRDSIHSYAITRSKATAGNGVVVATYALLRDSATFASRAMDKPTFEADSRNTKGYSLDFADDDTGYFYLAERMPVDFYSVRIYDVKLTDTERLHNRFVDLALYYGVTIPETLGANAALFEQLGSTLADVTFAKDATVYASEKLRVEAAIEALLVRSSASTLYVQEGLSALYTAFAGEDGYLGASGNDLVWYNRVLGKANATFEKTGWTYNSTLGGVGYDLIYGTVDTEQGTFSATCSQDTYARGNRLNLGLALLPQEDFTLEYVAYYSPVLSYDSATGKLVDTYETGIATAVTPTAGVYEPVDTVGFLSSYTTQHGGLFYVNSGVYVLGLLRWRSMDKAGYKTWEANGYGWGGSLVTANRASRSVETYAITRDEATAGDVVTAVYTHRLNGAFVDDNSFSSANTTGEHRYYAFEDDTEFYLSYKLGTTFYALRIYDRVLSEAEQKQNRMADMLGYYGVSLPEDFLENEERYAYVEDLCASLTFARDASAYNANKVLLQTAAAGEGSTVTFVVDGVETIEVVYGESIRLPESAGGKSLFAWQLLAEDGTHTSYAPGSILPISGNTTLRALVFSAPVTKYGVSIKPMASAGFGMRFAATLDKAEYLALAEEYGKSYIRLSMLITPKQYVERAGAFTREALRKYVERNAADPAKAFIEIPVTGFYTVDEDVCTLVGTIYNFTTVTREKDPAFAAIACVEVDTDRDGIVDRTVYGDYTAATCRSPKKAVEGVKYGDMQITDTQQLWLDSFLEYYKNKTYGEAGDKAVSVQREEIKNAFENAMNTVVDYTVHPFAEGEVAEKYAHIQAISFDGLTVGGKKTRIFAYLGLPEGASATDPVPAVVLVHGGGGHAYMEWVRLWNERGYAAIAMENTGYFPVTPGACPIDSNATAAREFPDYILDVIDESEYVIAPERNTGDVAYKEVDEHWQYHGLSAVILSHNVLRGQAAVDASRIGTVGVSWGGTMVSQVIGYDTRYAFAIPAYGSAYLGEPERPFGYYANSYIDDLWAAERNLDNFKNPILWFDWADDNNFVVNAYSNSYMHSLKNNAKNTFVLLKDWGHSHNHVWNKEHGYAFADSICFADAPDYARFTSQPVGQNAASTVFLPEGATNVRVRFHYLEEPMVYTTFNKFGTLNSSWLTEYWKTDAATLTLDTETGAITGTVPKNVRSYYISVTYEMNGVSLETSSRFVMVR